jgi:NACalpha-BTF3-like transcription factor
VLEHYRDAKERYQFQMGPVRGGLATALDVLTDALALVGQHGVYCRSARQPQYPAMDVRLVMEQIEQSKELIIAAMEELKMKP